MSRYLQVPITPIVDLGYKPPIDWWNAEIERKNKLAEKGQEDLDLIGATTFQFLDKDKDVATAKLASWKQKEEELANMYMQDPAAAAIELGKAKRQLTRELTTPGELAYEAQNKYNEFKAIKEATDKLKDKMPIEDWYNVQKQLENYSGLTQGADGKWSGSSFNGVIDFPDLPSEIDNTLKNMAPEQQSEFRSLGIEPRSGKVIIEKTNTKGKSEEDITNSITGMLTLKYGQFLPGFVEYHNLQHPDEAKILQELDITNTKKQLETIEAGLALPGLSDTEIAALQATKEKLQNKDFNDLDKYKQQSFVNSLVQFGTAQHNHYEIDKTRQYLDIAESTLDKSGGKTPKSVITGQGVVITGARKTPEINLEQVRKDNIEQGKVLKQTQRTVSQAMISQARILGFNTEMTDPLTNSSVIGPTDENTQAFLSTTREINNILGQGLDQDTEQQVIEDLINKNRLSVKGVLITPEGQANKDGEFKFDESYKYKDFISDHLKLVDNLNQLQTQKEIQKRAELQRENLFMSVKDETDIFEGTSYNNAVQLDNAYYSEPFIKQAQNMWKSFFNIDANSYEQFLITNNHASMDDLIELNNTLAEQDKAQKLPNNLNIVEKRMLMGLEARINKVNKNVETATVKNPELLTPLSEIITPTKGNSPANQDALKLFSSNISSMFQDLGFLHTLHVPDGRLLSTALSEDQGIDINNINTEKIDVYPIFNQVGNAPTILVKIPPYSDKGNTMAAVPIEVALTYGPDGKIKEQAVVDQLDLYARTVLESPDTSPEAMRLKESTKSFIGHRLFAGAIHDSWIDVTPNPVKGKETLPITIGEDVNGNQIQLSKNSEGTYQIYKNGSPALKPQERLQNIQDVYYALGSMAYAQGQQPDTGIFTEEEADIADRIFLAEAGPEGFKSTNPDSSALGGYQFLYSNHSDRIRQALSNATGADFTNTKYDDDTVKKAFLNNQTAQKYAMKSWIEEITPAAGKLQETGVKNGIDLPVAAWYYIIHREGLTGAQKWLNNLILTGQDTPTNPQNNEPIFDSLHKMYPSED